ncbi:potassium voltage-gated channel subfamily Hmember 7 [Striga asiatica]|uniref:Potassium voltage-gated channel subfamily Hmember 7 n=1 Tax=Striga asiatica TaxID=4170 RepID=A0A5A7P7V6_STRAF|nr:potassium voltage-gated channel subfamily Hmember 7 [Striga asiatica]
MGNGASEDSLSEMPSTVNPRSNLGNGASVDKNPQLLLQVEPILTNHVEDKSTSGPTHLIPFGPNSLPTHEPASSNPQPTNILHISPFLGLPIVEKKLQDGGGGSVESGGDWWCVCRWTTVWALGGGGLPAAAVRRRQC